MNSSNMDMYLAEVEHCLSFMYQAYYNTMQQELQSGINPNSTILTIEQYQDYMLNYYNYDYIALLKAQGYTFEVEPIANTELAQKHFNRTRTYSSQPGDCIDSIEPVEEKKKSNETNLDKSELEVLRNESKENLVEEVDKSETEKNLEQNKSSDITEIQSGDAESTTETAESINTNVENIEIPECKTTKNEAEILELLQSRNDKRPHYSLIFIGHVDAGKSTTCGHMLVELGEVDQRTLEKYEREAKEKNRESWQYAYVMDTNEEEKEKGKTVEVGRAHISTENRRFTILDAPGHSAYVPNMITGAAQADIAILIVSARYGEFEAGFERGGQTREHTLLAKTLGVGFIIVAINKMDESTVLWKKDRFDTISEKMMVFLKKCGYKKDQIYFIPISGFTGANIKEKASDPAAQWWTGGTIMSLLDELPLQSEDDKLSSALAPVRVSLLEGYKDQGMVYVLGRVEQGLFKTGTKLVIRPSNIKIQVTKILVDDEAVDFAAPGDNTTIRLSGVNEDNLKKGFILSSIIDPVPITRRIIAQLQIKDKRDGLPLYTEGYECIMHIHTAVEECRIEKLKEVRREGKVVKSPYMLVNDVGTVIISLTSSVALAKYDDTPQLGRFLLRDSGKTIGIGKVLKLVPITEN